MQVFFSVKCKLDFEEREENFCRLKLQLAIRDEKKTEHLHSKNIPAVIFGCAVAWRLVSGFFV